MNQQKVIKAVHTVTFYGERGMQTFSLDYFRRNSEPVELVGPLSLHRDHHGPYWTDNAGWAGAL